MREIKIEEKKKREGPPFATCELPLHELGKFVSSDVKVRVSLENERRELISLDDFYRNHSPAFHSPAFH